MQNPQYFLPAAGCNNDRKFLLFLRYILELLYAHSGWDWWFTRWDLVPSLDLFNKFIYKYFASGLCLYDIKFGRGKISGLLNKTILLLQNHFIASLARGKLKPSGSLAGYQAKKSFAKQVLCSISGTHIFCKIFTRKLAQNPFSTKFSQYSDQRDCQTT